MIKFPSFLIHDCLPLGHIFANNDTKQWEAEMLYHRVGAIEMWHI